MPQEGPDGIVNLGLGNFFRNPEHAPFTMVILLQNTHSTNQPKQQLLA